MNPFPPVLDHSAWLFFPFYFDGDRASDVKKRLRAPLLALTLADVAQHLPLPKNTRDRAIVKGTGMPVWKESNFVAAPDFHEQIGRILLGPLTPGGTKEKEDLFQGMRPWALSPEILNLLSGEWGRKGEGILLEATRSAKRRLGYGEPENEEPEPIRLHLTAGQLFLFGTGVGLFLLQVRFEKPSVTGKEVLSQLSCLELQEYLYDLSHVANHAPVIAWNGAKDGTSLETVVKTLLAGFDKSTTGDPLSILFPVWRRVFHYVGIKVAGAFEHDSAMEMLAYRLSRKYSTDYQPTPESLRKGQFRPFENVLHSVALEGGVVLVNADQRGKDEPSAFIENFLKDSFRLTYLQIAVIAIHEYAFMIRMSQESNVPTRFSNPSPEAIDSLKDYREKLLDFRMNYRFSHLSHIDLHNDIFALWRDALSLDRMLAEVSADATEVDAFLTFNEEEKYNYFRERATRIQSTFGVVVTASIFLVTACGMNFREFGGSSPLSIRLPGSAILVVCAITIAVALLCVVLAWILFKPRRLRKRSRR